MYCDQLSRSFECGRLTQSAQMGPLLYLLNSYQSYVILAYTYAKCTHLEYVANVYTLDYQHLQNAIAHGVWSS